jgi:hypothetical protein
MPHARRVVTALDFSTMPAVKWTGVLVVFVALLLLPGTAEAQKDAKDGGKKDKKEAPAPEPAGPPSLGESLTGLAKAEYEAGKLLYGDKDYANAIVKFKQAHKLSGDPRLHWNIAVCEKMLRQYSRMIESVRRYRTEAASMLTADDITQADEIVKTVEGFISELELKVDQKKVEIWVDGEKIAVTPLAQKVFLDVGKRTIAIKKEGYKDVVRKIEVPGGTKVALDIHMSKDLHRGRLVVIAGETDLISIDGKVVGQGRWEGSLKSGAHNLKVSGEGMTPQQQDVTVEDGKTRTIQIELLPVARDATATVLWIVGGVSLAAVTVVTSAFLFEPATTPPVEGSINPGSVQLTVGSW